ncbi:uncharacterized protein K489DRAFT_56167 [Dissoconium aciculare CBS 342.82]|uniref:Secreted protein n=1 Tax=Dissoconium aciculare CBS 342.82 TaxID=1314786 RepID=A0A6J3LYR5_9PEZI|nr:uncharacterized protein K489DRAFT_56167 [Dissoconium aciculare CBS 342.82]KAF1820439.1 hypothetical protein K489DRAFT_56167 [Dissoconium aciculare CBS 342.82]
MFAVILALSLSLLFFSLFSPRSHTQREVSIPIFLHRLGDVLLFLSLIKRIPFASDTQGRLAFTCKPQFIDKSMSFFLAILHNFCLMSLQATVAVERFL